jgi:integrase/recombinase XerD
MDIDIILQEGFEKWLITMGYADTTVYSSTRYVQNFFDWLRPTPIKDLNQINSQVIRSYINYLQQRPNKRRPGGLSDHYINGNINALKRFSRYLQESGKGTVEIDLRRRSVTSTPRIILTTSEVQAMYRACGTVSEAHAELLGLRDRAMLGIYYGCGLRRSEGAALNVSDVLLKEKLVYVRKGKNYRERYVPMTEAVKEDVVNYIQVAREKILSFKNTRHEALFLSMQVKRLCGNQIIGRVQLLARAAGINKEVGLHTLRHSIATHLLQSGMALEEVSQFLGHSSLESTQIYTHIANEQIS